jgi:flagellar biosynthesis activator protein FlaF
MNNPAQAYARTAQQTLQGRDLEAHVLLKSAARLQGIRDNWDIRQGELEEALLANRKIWTIFVSSMSADDCPLPSDVRSNILNLGMFVFNRTIKLTVEPLPAQLTVLIDINLNIAAGLRGRQADGQGSATAAA